MPFSLFIPQSVNRVETGRFARRIVSEKDSDRGGEDYRADDSDERDESRPAQHLRDKERDGYAEHNSD